MKRILLLSFVFLTVFAFGALAQRTVSGKITDETGEALPGVNVVIKGTTTGTTTDLDGNFRLSVDDGATLVFSYVGFENQEVEVGARSVIDISLSGVTELQEVVVTGYGSITAKKNVAAVDIVGSESIANVALADVNQIIQGRTPGVYATSPSGQPGAASDKKKKKKDKKKTKQKKKKKDKKKKKKGKAKNKEKKKEEKKKKGKNVNKKKPMKHKKTRTQKKKKIKKQREREQKRTKKS